MIRSSKKASPAVVRASRAEAPNGWWGVVKRKTSMPKSLSRSNRLEVIVESPPKLSGIPHAEPHGIQESLCRKYSKSPILPSAIKALAPNEDHPEPIRALFWVGGVWLGVVLGSLSYTDSTQTS